MAGGTAAVRTAMAGGSSTVRTMTGIGGNVRTAVSGSGATTTIVNLAGSCVSGIATSTTTSTTTTTTTSTATTTKVIPSSLLPSLGGLKVLQSGSGMKTAGRTGATGTTPGTPVVVNSSSALQTLMGHKMVVSGGKVLVQGGKVSFSSWIFLISECLTLKKNIWSF